MPGFIVIADEAANNRIMLVASLAAAGYQVKEAINPDHFWTILNGCKPDLIIMDADFGIGGCYENCHKFKAQNENANVPLIILTQDFDHHSRLVALRAGADEILPRPFDEHYLRARIRNLLRVRTLTNELMQRETTAVELGFSEPHEEFAPFTQLLAIEGKQPMSENWHSVLSDFPNSTTTYLPAETALDMIERHSISPDVIMFGPGLHLEHHGMTMIAELRARRLTRHSAIIVNHDPKMRLNAVTALDLGANELIENDSSAAEIRLRLRSQMALLAKTKRLRATLDRGLEMAVTDPLTGLFNRRYAMPHLMRIANAAEKKKQPFAVMVLDMDHFKRINDRYGHSAGDAVLVEISNRLRQNLRSEDMVARIGGEEFLVVMPDTNLDAARGAAERLRRLAESTPITLPDDKGEITVTMSIGVALGALEPEKITAIEQVVDMADRALLTAKNLGRNMVNLGQLAA